MQKTHKKFISFFLMCFFILQNIALAKTIEAWVAPSTIYLSIKAGNSAEFDLLTTTGTPPIKKLDVLFVIDRTGSMSDVINQVKETAINIMNNIKGKVPDSQFGVMAFQDYPGSYSYPGYSSIYGGPTDKPFELLQTITDNTDVIISSINSIYATGGGDGPESYTRVLFEAANGTPNWRSDSKKVVILLGDAPTHDEDFAGLNFGGDPGIDGIAQTSDDLQFEDVVKDLNDKKITVLAIQAGNWDAATFTFKGASIGYGGAIGTNGQYFNLQDVSEVTTEIMKMVTEEVSNIKELSLDVPEQYKSWFLSNPKCYTNVGPSTNNSFKITINVPAATPAGEYVIPINVMGDGSVLSSSIVKISVFSDFTTGSGKFEVASLDYGVMENAGSVSVTINRYNGSTGDVTLNYSTVDDTAKSGIDYIKTTGVVTFKDGEISKTINIPIIDNLVTNSNKTFYFNISNNSGSALLGTNVSSKITIVDDEEVKPGVLEFSGFDYAIDYNKDKITIIVNRINGSDGTVSVDYKTSDGTAISGKEYRSVSGTLVFNSGEMVKTFDIPLISSSVFKGEKYFNVILNNPTNGAMLGAKSTAIVKIKESPVATLNGILIMPNSIVKDPGKTEQLKVIATMTDGSTKDVTNECTYTSNNTSVAIVDGSGLVKVLETASPGIKSTIVATYGGKTASIVVTVVNSAVTVSDLSIEPSLVTKGPGETEQLKVVAIMTDGTKDDVTASSKGTTYTSSDTSIATVTSNGLVTIRSDAPHGSTVRITAKYNGKEAYCTITIENNGIKGLKLSTDATGFVPNKEFNVSLIREYNNGRKEDITSSATGTTYKINNSLATIDSEGKVKISSEAKKGQYFIVYAYNNNLSASLKITIEEVNTDLSGLRIETETQSFSAGSVFNIKVFADYVDGTSKDITASSEGTTYRVNNSLATIDTEGRVKIADTAKVGQYFVIYANNNGKLASKQINITSSNESLSSLQMTVSDDVLFIPGATFKVRVLGTFETNTVRDVTEGYGVTYSVNNSLATVDQQGNVTISPTAKAGQYFTIKATKNGKTVSKNITIVSDTNNLISMRIEVPSIEYKAGGASFSIKVYGMFQDGIERDITASTAGTTYAINNSLATIDANGNVTILPTARAGQSFLIYVYNGTKQISKWIYIK